MCGYILKNVKSTKPASNRAQVGVFRKKKGVKSVKDYGEHHGLIAFTVGFSLIGVILFGSLAGAMLPFALRAIRFDPAVASAPLVATLVDVSGLVIYFTVASQVLRTTILSPSVPGIVVMEHEKSSDSFGRFLGIKDGDNDPKEWNVQRVEWHNEKDNDRILVTIVEAEEIVRATTCSQIPGKLDLIGHSEASRWVVPTAIFGHPVEVICRLPQFRRHSDGQPCELTRPLPWEARAGAILAK